MSHLAFEIEWESPEGARGAELRATWAHLKVRVGDTVVTRVDSLASGSVRSGIYLPLYPIAEWIASNWWPLLHEIPSQRSAEGNDYNRRHNLRFGAEGFAFPDLTIYPEGKRVIIKWQPEIRPLCRVSFLEGGYAAIDREQIESVLRGFVQTVLDRLEDQGVKDTFLHQEWKAIAEAGDDEREFCRAVGCLGGDPYSPETDEYADALIALSNSIPAGVAEEFLIAADRENLAQQGSAIRNFITGAEALNLDLEPVIDIRRRCAPMRDALWSAGSHATTPWGQGYEMARGLRQLLELPAGRTASTPADIGALFGLDPAQWDAAVSGPLTGLDFAIAALATTRNDAPRIAIKANLDSGKVFALCRALFEYLFAPEHAAALVTDASSERQKRNRAFAAEFIAPASGISQHIGGKLHVTGEEIGWMAAQFGTSEFVIRHQIQNQHIAEIQDASYA